MPLNFSFLKSKQTLTVFALMATVLVGSFTAGYFIVKKTQSLTQTKTYGLVGTPIRVNPILAQSDVEKELVPFFYRGLVKFDKNFNVVGDLAESWKLENDNKTYLIELKPNEKWSDGKTITADDVVFTYTLIQKDHELLERFRYLDGIKVDLVNENNFKLTLPEVYSPFMSFLTVGILPKHIWEDVSIAELATVDTNLKPVGSTGNTIGSWQVKNNQIELIVVNRPNQTPLYLRFYDNEDLAFTAYKLGEIDVTFLDEPLAHELSNWANTTLIEQSTCGLYTSVFFNLTQKDRVSADVKFRKALKNFVGYGVTDVDLIDAIYLAPHWASTPLETINPFTTEEENSNTTELLTFSKADQAIEIVALPDSEKIAGNILTGLQKIGFNAKVTLSNQTDLLTQILPERKFDLLILPQQFNPDPDQYAFWHSAQTDINAGGLNLSGYTDRRVDKALEEGRVEFDLSKRKDLYTTVFERINTDAPVIFVKPKVLHLVERKSSTTEIEAQSCRLSDQQILSVID